jgi:toxoflavin synthase
MAHFDPIAASYAATNHERPLFKHCIYPSFVAAVGCVKEKSVLDLGCGDGHVTRILRNKGAEIVGVDESEGMVKFARTREDEEGLGIEYLTGKVGKLGRLGEFEVVTAAFLLHYSKTKAELESMVNDVYDNLRPGGRFITINNNPKNPLSEDKKYGNLISCDNAPIREGDILNVSHYPETSVAFPNYFWSWETYMAAIEKAGFSNIREMPFGVSQEGIKKEGKDFFQDFLDNPFFVMWACKR